MKTAICLEKYINSLRGTFSGVISNWRMLFFSITSTGARSRLISARLAIAAVRASSTPDTSAPWAVIAVNLYLAIVCLRPCRSTE